MRWFWTALAMGFMAATMTATAGSTCKPYDWKCQQAYNRQALRPGNAHFNAERQRSGGGANATCSGRPHIAAGDEAVANNPACR